MINKKILEEIANQIDVVRESSLDERTQLCLVDERLLIDWAGDIRLQAMGGFHTREEILTIAEEHARKNNRAATRDAVLRLGPSGDGRPVP